MSRPKKIKVHYSVIGSNGERYYCIELTQNQWTLVSAESVKQDQSILGNAWCADWMKNAKSFYAKRVDNKQNIKLHRHILGLSPKDVRQGDHKNQDTLDNRIDNLRISTPSQNSMNQKKKDGECYSRFKGVSWNKNNSKWIASVKVNGITKYLGYFESEIEAAKRYNEEAKLLHGEFACLNII